MSRPEPITDNDRLELLDVVGCGIWIYDGDNVRYANRSLADLSGYTVEQLLRPGFFQEVIHEDDREMIVARGQARIRGEDVPEQYEIRIRTQRGDVRRLAIHARRLDLDSGPVSVVSAVDVTSLRDAEQALRDGAGQVRSLLDSLPAHVITTDPAGKPTFVNHHWLELTGQTIEEAMATGTAALIHPEDAPGAARAWRKALATRLGYEIDYRVKNRFGQYRWQNFRIRPVTDGQGELLGWTSASVDVDDAKNLTQELALANERLEAAIRSKDEVLGLVSHELRTPLTTLLGNAQLLNRRASTLSEVDRQSLLSDLEADAVRLNVVIANMLVLSRAGASEEVEIEPVRINRVAAKAVEELRDRRPGRVVDLCVEEELPLALANPTYYRQVLGNLLSNADKYSPPGERITVRITAAGGKLLTSVRDRGSGLSDDELARVFEPFFRSRSHGSIYGIGLGLTVCLRLVELQSGSITVTNHPDGGCEFTFTTPIAPEVGDL